MILQPLIHIFKRLKISKHLEWDCTWEAWGLFFLAISHTSFSPRECVWDLFMPYIVLRFSQPISHSHALALIISPKLKSWRANNTICNFIILKITYSKGRHETSFHPFVPSSICPSVSSWFIYSDEKEWNIDAVRQRIIYINVVNFYFYFGVFGLRYTHPISFSTIEGVGLG